MGESKPLRQIERHYLAEALLDSMDDIRALFRESLRDVITPDAAMIGLRQIRRRLERCEIRLTGRREEETRDAEFHNGSRRIDG